MPLKACGLTEVKTFQKAFPDFQIYNLSKEHFNSVIYQGPEGGIPIYLYRHDQHFDVITKVTGFLNRSCFCFQCKKGYNTKEKKLIEKSRECHNHKLQPTPDTKRKRKMTKTNMYKTNKCTRSTQTSSFFPK